MLSIRDSFRPNRREALTAGALGAFGLSLPQLLKAESAKRGKEMSCILIFAWGGPAQQETFDMKPDAPAEFRGAFKPIPTNVPGTQICEHLPRMARLADKYAIIRSANHTNRIHNPGAYYALTGRKPSADVVQFPATRRDWPAVGSVMAKLRPATHSVPPYVMVPIFSNDIGIPTPGQHAGFLGAGFDPFVISNDPNQPNFQVQSLAPQPNVNPTRLGNRKALVGDMNNSLDYLGSTMAARSLDRHYERAYTLVSSPECKRAFDLTKEPDVVRNRYGRTRHGQSVLMARRLIEAGVRLVMVNDSEDNGQNKRWDTHGGGFKTLEKNLPETDNALASLIEDLHDRGRLDSTLIVWMGEFGRSPKPDKGGGRDHWPDCYSLLMAGAGIKGGAVYGASDAKAAYPKDNPCRPEDIHATIYAALDLADAEIMDNLGRPLAVHEGQPIRAILS